MIIITDKQVFKETKWNEPVILKCEKCHKHFTKTKNVVIGLIKRNCGKYCSHKCHDSNRIGKIKCNCSLCKKEVFLYPSDIKRKKTIYCSKSCAAKYNNVHKNYGGQRSKLEKWLEIKLKELYPNLVIFYNDRKTIKAELDIYIPELKLAFELNGIYHYEPIYGKEQLEKVQSNDKRKFQACLENKIELCIIDSSKQTYFKESTCLPFLNIITKIIDSKVFTT